MSQFCYSNQNPFVTGVISSSVKIIWDKHFVHRAKVSGSLLYYNSTVLFFKISKVATCLGWQVSQALMFVFSLSLQD